MSKRELLLYKRKESHPSRYSEQVRSSRQQSRRNENGILELFHSCRSLWAESIVYASQKTKVLSFSEDDTGSHEVKKSSGYGTLLPPRSKYDC